MPLKHCSDATPVTAKVAVNVKVRISTTFLKKMKNVAILVYPLLQIPSIQMIASLQTLAKQKSRMDDIQIDSVIQAHPDETTHLTNTEVTSSNINEMSHVMNKENRPPDKERDKPPAPSQNSTNHRKSKTSVFIVGDSMPQKVDGYLLTSSLKYQYLVKTKGFSTEKAIDMYDHIKPTQRDFKPEIFILHVETNISI